MRALQLTGASLLALMIAATPTVAADMPARVAKAPASVAAPLFNWTGFYAGVQGGYGWGDTEHTQAPASTGEFDLEGWAGGGTIGYNWQFAGPWVLGLEADISWSNIDASAGPGNVGNFGCGTASGCKTEVDWFGTARVRLGPTFDRLFAYVTGGFAYGRVHAELSGIAIFNRTDTRTGWTAGGGLEYAFAPNWSAKVEYLFIDLGSFNYCRTCTPDVNASAEFHLVRAGLNYRFATGKAPVAPVVTKY
ncbi:MAG: outer membrane protein [Xanthobacteraceae bacterium]